MIEHDHEPLEFRNETLKVDVLDPDDLRTAALRMCERAVKQCPGFDGLPCTYYRHCMYEIDCPTFAGASEVAHAICDPIGEYSAYQVKKAKEFQARKAKGLKH